MVISKADTERMDFIRSIIKEELKIHEESILSKISGMLQEYGLTNIRHDNRANKPTPPLYSNVTERTPIVNQPALTTNTGQFTDASRTFKPASLVIIGDSITGALNRNTVRKQTGLDVFIKSTASAVPATVITPDLSKSTDIILHAGTNCFTSRDNRYRLKTAEDVADQIKIKLAELKDAPTKPRVYYSAITHRYDKGDRDGNTDRINELIDDANKLLENYCTETGFEYIDHSNIDKADLHDSLHLNVDGAQKFSANIARKVSERNNVAPPDFIDLKVETVGERVDYRRTRQVKRTLDSYVGAGFPHYRHVPTNNRHINHGPVGPYNMFWPPPPPVHMMNSRYNYAY